MHEAADGTQTGSPADDAAVRDRRFLALALAVVAAVFSGVTIGVLISMHFAGPELPPDSPALRLLRAELDKDPERAEIKEAVRDEDLGLRQRFFQMLKRRDAGALLLLVGLAALAACAGWYAALDPRRPFPQSLAERADATRWRVRRRRQRVAVAVVGVAVLIALVWMGVSGGRSFPREAPSTQPAPPSVSREPASVYSENWPRFRGPTGMGIVAAGRWPKQWNGPTGENILWKTPVPLPGKNSPVLWGDRIFLTGADKKTQEVFCFHRADGRLLWRTRVASPQRPSAEPLEVFDDTGYAAPTAATDGERVYVFFATADVAAVDFDGKLVWVRNLGKPDSAYGLAASPLVYDKRLILQFDRGSDAEQGLSALIALDGATGRELWRTPRPVPNSWSSPVVIETEEGPELVTCGNPWVISYDPELGAELWRARCLSGDVAPLPVAAGGMVFVATEGAQVAAIRTGGIDDVTETHILWTADVGMSDASSPVANEMFLCQVTSSGLLTCYDAKTGKLLWEHQLDDGAWASPTLVGSLVYLPQADGKTVMFALAERFQLAGTAALGEPVYATPAFCDGRIIIRGGKHLFCIGE